MNKPYLTIITATYNACKDIKNTISSIRNQTDKNIQWIIIDGGSTDDSVKLFETNNDIIDFWLSESDFGIYDAWNKGIKYAKGEWIIFIGSGDYFKTTTTVEYAIHKLSRLPQKITFAYGGITLVSKKYAKVIEGEIDFTNWDLGLPKLPPHPAVFHRKNIFDAHNSFDSTYKIAGDTKFMLEHLKSDNFSYIGLNVTFMISGGISTRPQSWLMIKNEKMRIRNELNINPPPWYTRLQDIKLYLKPILYKIFGNRIEVILTFWQLLGANKSKSS